MTEHPPKYDRKEKESGQETCAEGATSLGLENEGQSESLAQGMGPLDSSVRTAVQRAEGP